ncbi:FHA domain-containing protein [Microbacterium lacticum]
MKRKRQAPSPRELPTLATVLVTPPPLPRPTQKEPAQPIAARTPRPATRLTTWTLALSDENQIPITGIGIIGRNPTGQDGYTHVVALEDPSRMLSRIHVAFGLTPEGDPWVSDMQSANGTFLDDTELTPGVRTEIRPGQVLRFGDHHARIVIG